MVTPTLSTRGTKLHEHWNLEARMGLLLSMPALLGFVLLTLGPMVASLILSFTDYTIAGEVHFVGLSNFIRMFSGEDIYFYKSLGVTFYYVILSVPLGIGCALGLAILLNRKVRFLPMFRTIFYLPSIVPMIATSMIWLWLLNPDMGLVNEMLGWLGIPPCMFLFDESTVIPTLAVMGMWTCGGTMIIFLAGLQGIPGHLYEAAEIDGAGGWRMFRSITLPMITPTLFFNILMGFIGAFQAFSQAYVMTDGGPNNASLFYAFYLYREAFTYSRIGSASAIAWVLFVIILVLSLGILRSSIKWVYYEGGGAS